MSDVSGPSGQDVILESAEAQQKSAEAQQKSADGAAGQVAGSFSASREAKPPVPLSLVALLVLICVEMALITPVAFYKLVQWAPSVGERHLSPFIFSWLAGIGLVFVGVRTVMLAFRRSPKGFIFGQMCLIIHIAACAIGASMGLLSHVVHGESELFYELMAGMAAVAALFMFWNKRFKQSASIRRFFGQPPLKTDSD